MSIATETQQLLKRFNLRPQKGLGQNFLIDDAALDHIVDAAELSQDDIVLEIGSGLGTLTRRLAQKAGHVIAVELDHNLLPALRYTLAGRPNVEIIHGDILALDIGELVRRSSGKHEPVPYIVVANLPYQITSAAIRHLLEASQRPKRMVLTMQLEVAQRLIAQPGQMSLLAISVQYYGKPKLVKRIKAKAFRPKPKVDSAVVRIDTYQSAPVVVHDLDQYFSVVKAGFGQKRKQLHNALKSGLSLSADLIDAVFARSSIDPTRRAQTLSLEEWAHLAEAVRTIASG